MFLSRHLFFSYGFTDEAPRLPNLRRSNNYTSCIDMRDAPSCQHRGKFPPLAGVKVHYYGFAKILTHMMAQNLLPARRVEPKPLGVQCGASSRDATTPARGPAVGDYGPPRVSILRVLDKACPWACPWQVPGIAFRSWYQYQVAKRTSPKPSGYWSYESISPQPGIRRTFRPQKRRWRS